MSIMKVESFVFLCAFLFSLFVFMFCVILSLKKKSYSMCNFLESIKKEVELTRVIKKKPRTSGVLLFGLEIFKGCHTFMESHLL